jgi:type I restriction enzyme, R subunit
MGRCFEKFSPGFFDLNIFDEAHRSIFNRFTEVIEYFDARMVGLTATPANFIDRDTFRTLGCENQTPTFLYTYEQAVAEKRLVDFRLYQAQTGFQRGGIRGADLSEEDRNALIEQGIDPDQIDYTGTELEVLVSNKDTLRRQWEEIMEHALLDQGGQLPAKTTLKRPQGSYKAPAKHQQSHLPARVTPIRLRTRYTRNISSSFRRADWSSSRAL